MIGDVNVFQGCFMLFYETAQNYLNQEEENLAPLTIRTYYWNLKKIEDFCPSLKCKDVDENFIRNFRTHLQKRGNKPNTINKTLSVFRIFCKKMLADKIFLQDPFEKIKIGRVHTRRGYLTTHELKQLYLNFIDRRRFLSKTEQDVMRVFLFSCFTGLRYSDLQSLNSSEIFDWKIRKLTHKTGEPVYIPIPIQARQLLPQNMEPGPIFKVVENSHFNRILRKVAPKLGYNKYIHCHLARHTFATTCITLGISLPATSKLLGHRNLETTLIYAKFVDTLLDKEMKKFNRLR